MNDIDPEVRNHLRRLIDPEPLDTAEALRSVHAARDAQREAPHRRVPIVAVAAAIAVVVMAVLAMTGGEQAPAYRLVGSAEADVVVRVDSADEQGPTATLTVGDATVRGTEVAGTPTPDGISFGPGASLPSDPTVDVPDESSLRIEGTFDAASASSLRSIFLSVNDAGTLDVSSVETWQLDSSGGSVVFTGPAGDEMGLIVQATVGADQHYFYFTVRIQG
jgi:hypothetical protein